MAKKKKFSKKSVQKSIFELWNTFSHTNELDEENSKKICLKQEELCNLTSSRIELLNKLASIEHNYNALANPEIKTAEDWLYGLPIESLNHLEPIGKRRTRLGDAKTRGDLKKSSFKILKEIESLDKIIKMAQLELITEKISWILAKSESQHIQKSLVSKIKSAQKEYS